MDQQNRYELRHLWKNLAEEAKARLDRAAESAEQLSENPEADSDAFNNAVRLYTEALEQFTNASKAYQDLVLDGTVLDDGLDFDPRRINARHGHREYNLGSGES